MMRDISAMVASLSLTVAISFGNSEGRRGMYSGRASMRSRICCTALNTGACSGSGGLLSASRGTSSSAYATNRRSASSQSNDGAAPAGRVPVSVRFEPVVDAMGSAGFGFDRVALNHAITATRTTTAAPKTIGSEPSMQRGYLFGG